MNKKNNLLSGNIFASLLIFTMPILGSLVLQVLYGSIDMLVIGFNCDTSSVSAISVGSLITYVATVFIAGLVTGASILIGQYVGEGNKKKTEEVLGTSIFLFIIISIIITAVMVLFTPLIVRAMNTPAESYNKTVQYVIICSIGMIFIVFYNLFSGIYRGIGNTKLPLLFVLIACIINVILDLILIVGFKMDVTGAAIATVAAQASSVFMSIFFIRKKTLPFEFLIKDIRIHKNIIPTILKIGYPIALQDTLTQISFMIVNSIVNNMGLNYSAGYGVAVKIISFILLVPTAFMLAISAFVAQNIGAKQIERAKKSMYAGMIMSLCISAVMFIIGFFFGNVPAHIFVNDKTVISLAADYLKGFSADCLMLSLLFCFCGYFDGCAKTKFVLVQGLIGAFLIRVPLSLFFSLTIHKSLVFIGMASPISSAICIIISVFYYKCSKWNKTQLPAPKNTQESLSGNVMF